MEKIKRCECTLKFLFNCRNNDVFPKIFMLEKYKQTTIQEEKQVLHANSTR